MVGLPDGRPLLLAYPLKRNSCIRLCPVQIIDQSPLSLSTPGSGNRRSPRPSFFVPNTGYIGSNRSAHPFRPRWVGSLRRIRFLVHELITRPFE